jgi:YHS domain-containing protein
MGSLLRLLLFAFALYLLFSGIRRLFLPSSAPRAHNPKRQERHDELMVQDPQCGRFVTEREALTASVRGRLLHFCSRDCRDLYTRTASHHR